tara:strand:- start:503 stop:706 length:204 start_codon:yes stop_codon:yes gene_type:complete
MKKGLLILLFLPSLVFSQNEKRLALVIDNDQIEIIYTQTPTEDELLKKILSMPNCTTLNVDDKVFTN